MGLADPWRPLEQERFLGSDPGAGGKRLDLGALDGGLEGEVEARRHVRIDCRVEPDRDRFLSRLNLRLIRWAGRKYRRFRRRTRRARAWLGRIRSDRPDLFVHWQILPSMRTTG